MIEHIQKICYAKANSYHNLIKCGENGKKVNDVFVKAMSLI